MPAPLTVPAPRAGGPVRALVADDHRLLRDGVRRALEGAGMVVVAEAGDGEEALRLVEELGPDVVLMDVSMPVLDGIDATLALHRRRPDLPVIVLTMHADEETLSRAAMAGAVGYLVKDCTSDEIVVAVEAALGAPVSSPTPGRSPGWAEHALTTRELEVIELLAQGASTAQVAARLFISPKTAKNHLASIYAKLDAANRTQAVVQAARLGLVKVG